MTDAGMLNRDAIETRLHPGNLLNRVEVLDAVESTQDALASGARQGVYKPGTCLAAERQTAGKGRRGRSWQSEPGQALTFSILTPNFFPRKPGWITVGAAVALAEVIDDSAGIRTSIKWPNDLYVSGRKLAGLLAHPIQAGDASLIVTGIGLNVNAAPPELPGKARVLPTDLKTLTGRPFDRNELFAAILNRLDAALRRLGNGETLFVVEALRGRSLLLGKPARFEWMRSIYEGTVRDHTDDLGILLDTDEGELRLPGETAHLIDFVSAEE